ncbi:MAG: glutaredoxin family protein [Gallionella sp.]|nr:glutaredoxin family protein [Gallionella sp.]
MKQMLWFCMAILALGAQAGEIYNWVDKEGKVHYSDTPPANVVDVERKKLSSQTPQIDDLPYETQRAQQNFPVVLYVTGGCGVPCDQARSLLNKRGIPFSEKLLQSQQEIDAFYKTSGSTGAPTLAIGKTYLSGFLEAKWHSELDIAGYPKTASYRQRVAPPAPKAPPASPAVPPQTPAPENQGAPTEPAAQ